MKKVASASDKVNLTVQPRALLGKKIKKLRREGLIPANVFGTDFKSVSISVNQKDFLKVYRVVRETGVVYLKLDKEEIPTLIKHLQRHPVNDSILHVDFRKIDLSKKITTEVPVKVVGVSEAVVQKGGVMLLQSELLSVEALPQNIPHEIEVDISTLKEIGTEIKVGDLKKSDKYEVKTPAEKVVVSVVAHKEESITPDTATTAPEVLTEAAAVEGEAGEEVKPAEGAAKAAEKPAEKAQNPAPAKK